MKLPLIYILILILLTWFASTFAPPKYPEPKHEVRVNPNQPSIDYWNGMRRTQYAWEMEHGLIYGEKGDIVGVIEAREVKSK